MSEWDDMNPGNVAWGSLRTTEKQNTSNARNNFIVVASPLLLLCQLKDCIKLELSHRGYFYSVFTDMFIENSCMFI